MRSIIGAQLQQHAAHPSNPYTNSSTSLASGREADLSAVRGSQSLGGQIPFLHCQWAAGQQVRGGPTRSSINHSSALSPQALRVSIPRRLLPGGT